MTFSLIHIEHVTSKIFLVIRIVCPHRSIVGDRQRLSLIMELSIHCYTTLILEIGYEFGYLVATLIVTVYNRLILSFFHYDVLAYI